MIGNVLLNSEYSFCTGIVKKKKAYLTNVHLEDISLDQEQTATSVWKLKCLNLFGYPGDRDLFWKIGLPGSYPGQGCWYL